MVLVHYQNIIQFIIIKINKKIYASHRVKPLEVELPNSVVLEIKETDPGVKGDTASGGTKPAILETGAQVMVPLFISIGEKIRVDTRNDSYLGRETQ